MPDIKYTLTADEKDVAAKLTKTEQNAAAVKSMLKQSTDEAKNLAAALRGVENALSTHGAASRAQISRSLRAQIDPSMLSGSEIRTLELQRERQAIREMQSANKASIYANRDRIREVFERGGWDGSDWEEFNRRSNRKALAARIRQDESVSAAWMQDARSRDAKGRLFDGYNSSTGMGKLGQGDGPPLNLAGKIGGALSGFGKAVATAGQPVLAGAFFAEQFLAGFQQKMGGDYFEALKGIEPRYRTLMGLEDNGAKQGSLREAVRNKAVSMGMDTNFVAAAMAENQASTGNMTDAQRKAMFKSTMLLQSVAGGDVQPLGAGLISFQNLYGDQVGGVDRGAALFKATADYAKFSTTTLAQLGPDALAYFRAFGVGPEDALATLAVGSLRTGRPENFFTGMKYVASNMDRAVAKGWTKKDAPWDQKLRDLAARSPEELMDTQMFGREGFTAISEAIRGADEIKRVSASFKKIKGTDLARREMTLLSDPINMMSRLASSVDVAGSQGYELLMEQGGPEGFRLAGNALSKRLAMEGQKLNNPVIASLTDKTKSIDLARQGDTYTNMLLPHMLQAMAADGPAGALKAQALKLATGQVQLDSVDIASWQAIKNSFGNIGKPIPTTRPSDGNDSADYLKMVSSQKLYGMTAEEYGQYITLKNNNRGYEAESFRAALVKKYSKGDMNQLVAQTSADAKELARRNEIDSRAGPYAKFTNPVDDYIEGLGDDAPFRKKAAKMVRTRLFDNIIKLDQATKMGSKSAMDFWRGRVSTGATSFASEVDSLEYGMLSNAFGEEYQKRTNALRTADPKVSGYETIKSRKSEIDKMLEDMKADGTISRDELASAATKLGLGTSKSEETEIGDKSIDKMAKALAAAVKEGMTTKSPTTADAAANQNNPTPPARP